METKNKTSEIGGKHYEKLPLEPVELFWTFRMSWFQAEPIKYLSRFWNYGEEGLDDLKKAIHVVDMANDYQVKQFWPKSEYPLEDYEIELIELFASQFRNLGWFSQSDSGLKNESYYRIFVGLICHIIRCKWVDAWSELTDMVYYFYGDEELREILFSYSRKSLCTRR